MKVVSTRSFQPIFYLLWLGLGLIQAANTELLDDEAYYWVFSQHLDWGYFDHPPMTALLIRGGYWIFPNELGVRLLPVLLSTATVWLLEKMTREENPGLFYSIVLSMIAMQIGGFLAVPDIPLLFFTTLFFYRYKLFCKDENWKTLIGLGLSASLLLYSKYHGVLILFFTLLSDLRLLRNPRVYGAGLLALILFLPHLWWQYEHDWVSFRYHLQESNVNPYKISYTIEYVLGQLVLPGPLIGLILLPAAFLFRTKDRLYRALRFTAIGIYLFFLLSSFRGRVEANWTAPALIPVILLSHAFLSERISWKKWISRSLPVSLLLILLLRIGMIVDFLPTKTIRERFHGWKQWPDSLYERTEGKPVVWLNSYQRASKYAFYSGQLTHSLNFYRERRSNYNFWPIEDSMQGKKVVIMDIYDMKRFSDSIKTPIGWVGYRTDSSFQGTSKHWFSVETEKLSVGRNDSLFLSGKYIPAALGGKSDSLRIGVFQKGKWLKDIGIDRKYWEQTGYKGWVRLAVKHDLSPGEYILLLALNAKDLLPTHNSRKIRLTVDQ
jgi:hypothetical protein